MTYKDLSSGAKRLLIRRWQEFTPIAVEIQGFDDTSGLKIGMYIARAALERELADARLAYVQALVATGILDVGQELPVDDLLWESHPMNLQAEMEA